MKKLISSEDGEPNWDWGSSPIEKQMAKKLKEVDPAELQLDEAFFNRLHDKVMKRFDAIASSASHQPVQSRITRSQSKIWASRDELGVNLQKPHTLGNRRVEAPLKINQESLSVLIKK